MGNFPYLAVLVAAIAHFVVGMLWYSPLLFGNVWMKLMNFTKKDMEDGKKMMGLSMFGGLVTSVLIAGVMSYFLQMLGTMESISGAMWFGFMIWLGFNAPVSFGTVLWERKSFKLYLLGTTYWLVSFLVIPAVLVAM